MCPPSFYVDYEMKLLVVIINSPEKEGKAAPHPQKK